MHKLIEYACDELEELEKKAAKGSMSAAEVEYADKLASLKKNLLKGDMLYNELDADGEYSGNMGYRRGGSYARGRGRRDSMGRYSRDASDMVEKLRELMNEAPDAQSKREIERLVEKMEQM